CRSTWRVCVADRPPLGGIGHAVRGLPLEAARRPERREHQARPAPPATAIVSRRLRIGIDTGGTFTDVVAVDEASGESFTTKTPSTARDPSMGVLDGIRKILRLVDHAVPARASAPAVTAVSHGTTVATNALLQDRFPALGLVTTEGFRHVLEIARQAV